MISRNMSSRLGALRTSHARCMTPVLKSTKYIAQKVCFLLYKTPSQYKPIGLIWWSWRPANRALTTAGCVSNCGPKSLAGPETSTTDCANARVGKLTKTCSCSRLQEALANSGVDTPYRSGREHSRASMAFKCSACPLSRLGGIPMSSTPQPPASVT